MRNSAQRGGGIVWQTGEGALINNTIADNDAREGSGIYGYYGSPQNMWVNNIIVAKASQAAIFCSFGSGETPTIRNNNVYSLGSLAYGEFCSNLTGKNGNISANPLFINPSAGDYHLCLGSPSIDAGDNTAPNLPATDFEGNPRITDGNGDGTSVIDMGVYEARAPTLTINDVSVAEGNAGTVNAVFTVTLTGAQGSCLPVRVNFATADSTAAVAGNDYTATAGMLTFNPPFTSNTLTQTITVPVIGDTTFEPDETFFVNIAAVNATVTDAQGQGTIINDDATVSPVGPGLPFPDTSEVNDQKVGSVLVYNLYSSNAASPQTQNTRLAITNINPASDIAVHLFFVDGQTCSIADAIICLTKNQTATFLASDLDPGTTGYVVAIASDPTTGCPVNFNFLIGDAYVKLASGHAANLGAEAFAALAGGPVACDGNAVTAQLNFDGVSYNRAPRTLAVSNIPARLDGNETLLVINRFGGNLAIGAAPLTNLFGIFYDDAENALSFSFAPGTCQFRAVLLNTFPRLTPRFETFIPAGRSGWARLYSASDIGLLGAVLNFNQNAGTTAGAFNQGHNLHKLTLTSTQTLIIPVFPPNCLD